MFEWLYGFEDPDSMIASWIEKSVNPIVKYNVKPARKYHTLIVYLVLAEDENVVAFNVALTA